MKYFRKILLTLPLLILIFGAISLSLSQSVSQNHYANKETWWEIQSIDTVKYSRDLAREKAKDTSFDATIDTQVRLISETGATHVAIGTPYAEEFVPFLKRWVMAARKYDLKVWFRGNIPGWEGWFGYPKIGRNEHTEQIRDFIISNGGLFEEGDIFSSCTECENGGPGDPRRTGDVAGFRKFLIEEFKATNDSFRKIGKNVRSNFVPMNGDVALLIMDKETTTALGGIVVIDHYVRSSQKLVEDVKNISNKSGGKVLLGEFGAPIPDIHGNFNEKDQAKWINDTLSGVSEIPVLIGANYWAGFGASSKLWDDDFKERAAVNVIKNFFQPKIFQGTIVNELGKPIASANLTLGKHTVLSQKDGKFSIPFLSDDSLLRIKAEGYHDQGLRVGSVVENKIVMIRERKDLIFNLRAYLYRMFTRNR